MRNQFEKQLQQLNEDLISMGALCKEAVADAMTALLYSDKQARQKAFLTEYEIDHKERDIESLCEAFAPAAAGSKRSEKYFRSTKDDL